MYVSPFLRYLPFSLFLVPLLIVFVEKFFIRYVYHIRYHYTKNSNSLLNTYVSSLLIDVFFVSCSIYRCEMKLDQFYSCLIKGSLEREDVANMEQENIKNSHEIQQTFRNSANIYYSYLYRLVSHV